MLVGTHQVVGTMLFALDAVSIETTIGIQQGRGRERGGERERERERDGSSSLGFSWWD
jgi:hypothetical protein